MNFTFDSYINLINLIRDNGYQIVDYDNYGDYKDQRCCILRHDIDYDIKKAFEMSEIETKNNIYSTWFVIISGDLYNPFSANNISMLRRMTESGHKLGLHFDEVAYKGLSVQEKIECADAEREMLEKALQVPINAVSMHRPSRQDLDEDWKFRNMHNSYSQEFFREFKYLSDSRRRWREPIEEIVASKAYKHIHILTHAFWYNDDELDIRSSILNFINAAKYERYDTFNDNFSELESIISRGEIK